MNVPQRDRGPLDGLTIVRFAHAFTSGGGMERILDDLDQAILARNAVTIVRMYLARPDQTPEEKVLTVGRGRLVLVSLALRDAHAQLSPNREPEGPSFSQRIRDQVLYHPVIWALGLKHLVKRRRLPRRPGEAATAGATFAGLCARYRVDLCMMHFFGGSDADEIIAEARRRHIPIALENHFANDRFLNLSIRKHVMLADAVGGMNALDVPSFLAGRFHNLADGIDVTYFDRPNAVPPPDQPSGPVLFLPARIVRPKGQLDLVRAAATLRGRGLDVTVAIAGRVESAQFLDELKAEIARLDMGRHVRFLGELGPAGLRDWYAASAIQAFPTYHHEGLGRIIVEAQAMQVPVVAYATGGVSEGVSDGHTGFLVKTGDLATFTDKLELLLRDESLRRSMGAAGRKFVVDRYSLDALAARHESFYLGAMARQRP